MFSGVNLSCHRPFHPRRRHLVAPMRHRGPVADERPTLGQTQRDRWRRTSHGLYVQSWVDSTVVDQRIVEAAAVDPAAHAVSGWAGLRWLGGRWFERDAGMAHSDPSRS